MLDNPLSATTTGIVIKLINTNSCLHFLYKHVFMFQSNCDQFALNTTNINSIKSANLSELFEEVQNYPLGLGKETETHQDQSARHFSAMYFVFLCAYFDCACVCLLQVGSDSYQCQWAPVKLLEVSWEVICSKKTSATHCECAIATIVHHPSKRKK